jgi:hypothetical protein
MTGIFFIKDEFNKPSINKHGRKQHYCTLNITARISDTCLSADREAERPERGTSEDLQRIARPRGTSGNAQ